MTIKPKKSTYLSAFFIVGHFIKQLAISVTGNSELQFCLQASIWRYLYRLGYYKYRIALANVLKA